MRTATVMAFLPMLLAACQAMTPAPQTVPPVAEPVVQPATPVPQGDTCGAARWIWLVGRDVAAVDRGALPPSARVVGPGDAVTLDFSATRLNIAHDAAGIVTELTCG